MRGKIESIVRVEGARIEMQKRQNVPAAVHSKCPHCGDTCSVDLTRQHLSYPTVDGTSTVYFGHECADGHDVEWQCYVIVRVTVEPAP